MTSPKNNSKNKINNNSKSPKDKLLKNNVDQNNLEGEQRLIDPKINQIISHQPSINLPPVPKDSSELDVWLNMYRVKMEIDRYNQEQLKFIVEREELNSKLKRLSADEALLSREIETSKLNLELVRYSIGVAKRTENTAGNTNSEAMVYTFSGKVSEESVSQAISNLDEWSRRKPKNELKILLTSPGGDILHGLSLYDFILVLRNRGHKVTVVIMGFAASMGSILAQAGDRRIMTPNAYLMLHEAATWTGGKSSEIEEEMSTLRKFEEKLVTILCSRGNFTKEELKKKWFKKDLWFDAKECLKLGLIDEIGLE